MPRLPVNSKQRIFQQANLDGLCQVPVPRIPGTSGRVETPAPRKGEHSSEILAELGLDAGEIQELFDSGVVSV
jgi:crotonobetainyl-CoA:carnitine CoA-transferase CaiB-like acyl-CoA transferase